MTSQRRSRRSWLILAVLIAMFALAACSGDDDATDATEAPDDSTETTEAAPDTTEGETETTEAAPDTTEGAAETTEAPDAGSDRYGGTLTIAQSADPDTLSPYIWGAQVTRNVLIQLYDTLVRNNLETYEIEPGLAESWEVSDDGLTWTFNLRETNFHDGRPFTAADAVWSMEQALDEAATRTAPLLSTVESVTAVDDRTLEITLSAPDNILLSTLLDVYITPDDADVDYQDGPVGTGPFKFVSWDRNQQITLERNDEYWMTDADGNSLPYLDEILVKPVPDGSVAALQLQNGESDIVGSVDFAQIEGLEAAGAVIPQLPEGVSSGFYDLRINTREGPLSDERVRQAISYALDRDAINVALLNQMTTTSNSIPESSPYFNPDATNFVPRDLDKAAELLAEAGYADGVDLGTMLTHPDIGFAYQVIGALVQAQLAEAGMTVEIEQVDVGTWVAQVFDERDFDMGQSGGLPKPNEYDLIAHLYAKTIGGATGWDEQNPAFYELLDEARSMADPAEYEAAIKELQAMMTLGQANVIIGGRAASTAHGANVQNMIPDAQSNVFLTSVWLEE